MRSAGLRRGTKRLATTTDSESPDTSSEWTESEDSVEEANENPSNSQRVLRSSSKYKKKDGKGNAPGHVFMTQEEVLIDLMSETEDDVDVKPEIPLKVEEHGYALHSSRNSNGALKKIKMENTDTKVLPLVRVGAAQGEVLHPDILCSWIGITDNQMQIDENRVVCFDNDVKLLLGALFGVYVEQVISGSCELAANRIRAEERGKPKPKRFKRDSVDVNDVRVFLNTKKI